MPCNSKHLTCHCACARDLHGSVIFVIRTLNSIYLSLFLDMFPPPPRPKMSFGQRNVTTYVHNICKWHLGSRWGTGLLTPKKTTCNLKLLHQVANTQFWNILRHQQYKYIKLLVGGRGWTTIYPAFSVFYACIVLKIGLIIRISKRHHPLKQNWHLT